MAQEEHKYAEGFDGQREQGSQTETVFGLRDLPTVKEIVNKKMQEKRKLEEVDVAGRTGTYRKVLKFSDPRKLGCNLSKIQTKRPNLRVFCFSFTFPRSLHG